MRNEKDMPAHGSAAMVEALREGFERGVLRDLGERKKALQRLHDTIGRREEAILSALESDLGKPRLEAYLSEVHFVRKEIRHVLRNLTSWAKPKRVRTDFNLWPARSRVCPEPLGVVLILGPWNYPFQLVLSPLIAAIAAGNCVALKPSELAPATGRLLSSLVHEVFGPEEVAVVDGGPETAAALLKLKFDHIFFTGSRRVGQLILKAAAETLTPVTLELGGKCPCIVDVDVNLDLAVQRIVAGKFFNAGQTCVAPDYVCVDERIYAEFVRSTLKTIRAFFPPETRSPDLARIVNTAHFDRLSDLIRGNGHAIGVPDRERLFFPPTLLDSVTWSDPVMQEEIFGPILPVLAYSNVESLLRELSARPKPLALYVFSRNRSFVDRAVRGTPSGGVCVNDTIMQITNLNLLFGGTGESGFGRYHGRYGFETFSHYRAVMSRSLALDLFALRPPYGSAFGWIRRILR